MPLNVEIVTAERVVRTEPNVEALVVPGTDGQLTILPSHAALMTTLTFGEIIMRRGNDEDVFAVSGGFLEVRRDHVTILADQAETADDIDEPRADEARRRAEERLRRYRDQNVANVDVARAQASLQRALVRLRAAERRRRRPGAPRPG